MLLQAKKKHATLQHKTVLMSDIIVQQQQQHTPDGNRKSFEKKLRLLFLNKNLRANLHMSQQHELNVAISLMNYTLTNAAIPRVTLYSSKVHVFELKCSHEWLCCVVCLRPHFIIIIIVITIAVCRICSTCKYVRYSIQQPL